MFNTGEVDELFAGTTRALQRSQVLLDERRSTTQSQLAVPATFCSAAASAASNAVGSNAAAPYASRSNSFADTVRSLQALGAFRAYVEATSEMMAKVETEGHAPSAAMQQRRAKGQDFALLQSLTRGLRGATAAPWRTADATASLWASAADTAGGSEGGGGGDAATAGPSEVGTSAAPSRSSGAQLTASLLFSAFCVDLACGVPRAASAVAAELTCVLETSRRGIGTSPETAAAAPLVSEWARDGSAKLGAVLRDASSLLPPAAATRLVARVADVLLRPSHATVHAAAHRGCERLSGGQLLLPALDYHLLDQHPSTLAARWLLQPLQAAAEHLRADYHASAAAFQRQCGWLLRLVATLLYACQSAAVPPAPSSAESAARPPLHRLWRTAQRLCDTWLMPLERTLGTGTARHGMSAAFYGALVQPHAHLVQRLLTCSPGTAAAVQQSREWAGILHSAHYRLLLVLERLAHAEVAQASGTSRTSSKQRTYEAILRLSGGKVSVALLQTLAEDKQLVLEETPSRSPDGHRLYRLHGGLHDDRGAGKAVFVYVDDGAFFMKVGRTRVFERVRSVEDIFKPLQ